MTTHKTTKQVKKKPTPQSKALTSRSFRVDPKRVAKAEELGIDVSETIRRSIDKAIMTVGKECPTCGAKR